MTYRSNRFCLSLFPVLLCLCMICSSITWSADLDALSSNSEVILFGKVMETQCHWAETSLNIMTHTKFLVEKNIKGLFRSGDTVTIETLGGCINGMKQVRTGSPALNKGEHALVFLNSGPKGVYVVYQQNEGVIPFSDHGEDQISHDGRKLSSLISEVSLVLQK
ncbi:MAG: hypothetical protein AABY87_13880 [bacterium]